MSTAIDGTREGTRPTYAEELAELLRVLVVAGVPLGVVVAGLGGRLAMLVLRLTSPDVVLGQETDDGFVIGEITVAGTYNLLVLGATVGFIGAAAYVAVAPWLLGPRWARAATTGVTAGALVGSMLLHDDGLDFTVLEPLWLAIVLFVGLPTVFGVLLAYAVERVEEPGHWAARGQRRGIVPALVLLLFVPALSWWCRSQSSWLRCCRCVGRCSSRCGARARPPGWCGAASPRFRFWPSSRWPGTCGSSSGDGA